MLLKNLAICLSLLLFLPPDAFGQGNKRLLLYNYTVCAVKKKNPLPCVQQTKKNWQVITLNYGFHMEHFSLSLIINKKNKGNPASLHLPPSSPPPKAPLW